MTEVASEPTPANSARTVQIRLSEAEVTLFEGDCREVLSNLGDGSVHLVLTDPPYFLDGLDERWRKGTGGPRETGTIGTLPVGMKFDPAQGYRLQEFLHPVAQELLRVLKPGGFLLMFSAPRLYHRAAVAVEDAGFEVRDAFAWRFTANAQFKAFKMDHFIRRRKDMSDEQKARTIKALDGRRTPQLRPQFESILCAQKPREGTFVDNWLSHETGLIDAQSSLTERVPETVMTVEKPKKDKFNAHLTTKPLRLCEHLISLFSADGQTVLDPFAGSGTTCLAASRTGRKSIGIEINPQYIEIARTRIETG